MFKNDKDFVYIGNYIIEKSTGEWLHRMAGGDIFGGGSGSQSSQGFYNLPKDIQNQILGATESSSWRSYQTQDQQQQAINRLLQTGNPSTFAPVTNYLSSVLSPSYLDLTTNNPTIAALYNDYQKNVNNTQGTAYSNANKAGQFYSSYAGDYVNKLTDSLTQDLTNSLGMQYTTLLGNQLTAANDYTSALSAMGALQQMGLEGTQTWYDQFYKLISALSGTSTSSSQDSSSLDSAAGSAGWLLGYALGGL